MATAQANLPLLSSYRVLDLSDEKGAYGTKILADLGADVIKVEPVGGCPSRRVPPFTRGKPQPEDSLFFAFYQTNKRSVTLNLDSVTGRDLLFSLVRLADVIVESYPPGHLDERKLGYDLLARQKAGLIVTSITGFGADGPYAGHKDPEPVVFAMAGPLSASGMPGEAPCLPPGHMAYGIASTFAALGTIIALFNRGMTGEGQHVEISAQQCASLITDSAIPKLSIEKVVVRRQGDTYRSITPGSLYRCRDGYVRIVAGQPRHWRGLLEWMGHPQAFADPAWENREKRNEEREFVDSIVESFTSNRTRDELFLEGQRHQVPVTPVYTPAEFLQSGWAGSRGLVTEVAPPAGGSHKTIGPPFLVDGRRPSLARSAPTLGEHNREVFVEEARLLTDAELDHLHASGVI